MRPTYAEIDLDSIRHNAALLKGAVGEQVELMAVVKADGYGHGAVPVARAALAGGASRLAVAMVEEGAALRAAGLDAPILVLGRTPPSQVAEAIGLDLTLTLVTLADGEETAAAAQRLGRRARVHVKVDTGMGRLGFPVTRARVKDEIARLCRLDGLEVEGIYTHFAASEEDHPFTLAQLERFHDLLGQLRAEGIEFPLRHAANSGAIWNVPEAHLDMVRVGISLYGYHPAGRAGATGRAAALRPALTWKTAVAQVKEVPAGTSVSYGRTYVTRGPERLATLPVGYADGYSRALSNRGQVLVGGRRAPVVGRVCMDQIVINVTHVDGVRPGDEVVLIGAQGGEELTADDMAGLLGTISYEVLCAIGKRVPRLYRGGGATGG